MPTQTRDYRLGSFWPRLVLPLAAFAIGGLFGRFILAHPTADPNPSNTPSAANLPERVTALARLQPVGRVVPISGLPGDRIETMEALYPGQKLTFNQPIATLSSHAQRQLEVRIATQQLAEAREQLAQSRTAGEKKIAIAEAELAQAQAAKADDLAALSAQVNVAQTQEESASKALMRLNTLRGENVKVADEDYDRVRLLQSQASAGLIAAQSALKKARINYDEGEKTATLKIAAARAELAEAIAKVPIASAAERVKLAEQVRDLTVLKAPIAGTVLSISGRVGQPTGMTPIVQMADLTEMTAVAEVYESDVSRVLDWLTQHPVTAEVSHPPALVQPLRGVVRSERDVARMIARNQVFPGGPREDADRRVVEVVVHLDAASTALAARFVGLQVTVTLASGK